MTCQNVDYYLGIELYSNRLWNLCDVDLPKHGNVVCGVKKVLPAARVKISARMPQKVNLVHRKKIHPQVQVVCLQC